MKHSAESGKGGLLWDSPCWEVSIAQYFLNEKHSLSISYFDITLKTYLVVHVTA